MNTLSCCFPWYYESWAHEIRLLPMRNCFSFHATYQILGSAGHAPLPLFIFYLGAIFDFDSHPWPLQIAFIFGIYRHDWTCREIRPQRRIPIPAGHLRAAQGFLWLVLASSQPGRVISFQFVFILNWLLTGHHAWARLFHVPRWIAYFVNKFTTLLTFHPFACVPIRTV